MFVTGLPQSCSFVLQNTVLSLSQEVAIDMTDFDRDKHYVRKHLWQRVTKAIKRFNLISDGDRIGVGLSGGKDSATLLFVLSALTKRAPVSFEVVGLHVDCGFGTDMRPLEALCERVGVGLQVSEAPIALALKNRPDKASACSLCANLRRGALNSLAKSSGCNKIALGHHSDDALETLLLCMIYEGRIASLKPIAHQDRIGVTLIRPLILVRREAIVRSVSYYSLPWAKNPCPYEGHTKRDFVRACLRRLEAAEPGAANRLIASLSHVDADSLWIERDK